MKRKNKINSEKFIDLAYIVLLLSVMIGSLKVVLNHFI
jgi:hypothetical protein